MAPIGPSRQVSLVAFNRRISYWAQSIKVPNSAKNEKYYSKRHAHSAWPAKWQGFLVLLCVHLVLFLVDEMKFNGDSGHCWDGWTLLERI